MDDPLYAIDWFTAFRPAALAMLAGRSPYEVELFYNPPWALLPLLPLALLPEWAGRWLLLVVTFALFAFAAWRLGARPVALGIFLLSPPVVHSLLNGNLDALVLVGATLLPPVGLFLVLIKPQMGAPLALFWAVEAWRIGGFRRLLITFAPVTLVLALSLAVYGPWPLRAGTATGYAWNASLWPWSLLPGLGLLASSLIRREPRAALAAGPMLSPYLAFHSWCAALAALVRRPLALSLVTIGLWFLVVTQT